MLSASSICSGGACKDRHWVTLMVHIDKIPFPVVSHYCTALQVAVMQGNTMNRLKRSVSAVNMDVNITGFKLFSCANILCRQNCIVTFSKPCKVSW